MKKKLAVSALIVFLVLSFFVGLIEVPEVEAYGEGWLGSYTYRKQVDIEAGGESISDYQMKFTLCYDELFYGEYYDLSGMSVTYTVDTANHHAFNPVHDTAVVQLDMYIDGHHWLYVGYDAVAQSTGINLFMANDTDGQWTAYSGNPILSSGSAEYRFACGVWNGSYISVFTANHVSNVIKRYTSTDGYTLTFEENIVSNPDPAQPTDPFVWLNPNDDLWYMYFMEGDDFLCMNSSTVEDLNTATPVLVGEKADYLPAAGTTWGTPSVMFKDEQYWLVMEVGGYEDGWMVHAYASVEPTSGFIELVDSPIAGNHSEDNAESCPIHVLSEDGSKAYLYTNLDRTTWSQRTRVIYNHTEGVVSLEGNCEEDFIDVHPADSDGSTQLQYWNETTVNGLFSHVWVKILDDVGSNQVMYWYYGYDSATYDANGERTFLEFDDFEDETTNSTKWDYTINNNGHYEETGGYMRLWLTSSSSSCYVYSQNKYEDNVAVVSSSKSVNVDANYVYLGLASAGLSQWTAYDKMSSDLTRFYNKLSAYEYTEAYAYIHESYHIYEVAWEDGVQTQATWQYRDADVITLTSQVPTSDMGIWLGVSTTSGNDHWIDWVCLRSWIEEEPTVGTVGEEESMSGETPVNGSAYISDMDTSDNIYAQRKLYTAVSSASDADGFADINYMEFSLKQSSSYRVTFRYTEDTNSFSTEVGGSEWTLDASSSNSSSGLTITVTWIFSAQWDATEEADLEVEVYVQDSVSFSDTDTAQENYVDVVTTLVTAGFAADDGRINLGESATLSGTVYYADDPSSSTASAYYPPDSEFTSVDFHDSSHVEVGSDSSIVDGYFSGSFNIPSAVQLNTYHVWIDMADADYTDADASDGDTAGVIGDRIIIESLGLTDSRINADGVDTSTLYATASLEYDSHALGYGDSLEISSVSMSWGGSQFEGSTAASSSVTSVTYDTFSSGSEVTYGITAGNMDSKTVTLIYDRLKVVSYSVNDTRMNIDDVADLNVTLVFEYDDTACTTGTIAVNDEAASHLENGIYNLQPSYAVTTGVNYDNVTCSAESTYGITEVNQNSQSQLVIWDRILVQFEASTTNPFNNEVVLFSTVLSYEYDSVNVSSYTYDVNRNDTLFKDDYSEEEFVDYNSDTTYVYDFVSFTESTYGITAFLDPSDLIITWFGSGSGEADATDAYMLFIAGTLLVAILVSCGTFLLLKQRR